MKYYNAKWGKSQIEDVLNSDVGKEFLEDVKDTVKFSIETIFRDFINMLSNAEMDGFLSYEHGDRRTKERVGINNKRNGYRTVIPKIPELKGAEVKIPRDRYGKFSPMTLKMLTEKKDDVNNLIFELYTRGISNDEIGRGIDKILGHHYSRSAISAITKKFQSDVDRWRNRPLQEDYLIVMLDATFVKMRRDSVQSEAVYTLMGLRTDLKREILGVYNAPTENIVNWGEILANLKNRGVKNVLLFIADGLKGLENVITEHFPKSYFQKCVVHKMRNLENKVRASDKKAVADDFKMNVLQLGNDNYDLDDALLNIQAFLIRWSKYPNLKKMFDENEMEYYFTYLKFPAAIRRMIYTTNWIENSNSKIKQTTKKRRSFPNPESAMRLVCFRLMKFEEECLMKYPVTSFRSCLVELLKRFEKMKSES